MRRSPLNRRLLPAALLAFSGCLGGGSQTELLEARLRDQGDMMARYEKVLQSTQSELELARKESVLLREQIANLDAQPLLPEHADVLLRAEKLAFHGMMTGCRDADGLPGEESLSVVLIPQSEKGETVRLIGELEVEALDLSRPAEEQRIGRWTYTAEEARDCWHSGFLASGFQLDLPWHALPQGDEIILHARMHAPDGRRFNASHKLKVDPAQLALSGKQPGAEEPRRLAASPAREPARASAAATTGREFPTGAEIQQLNASSRPAEPQPAPRSHSPRQASARSMNGADFLREIDEPAAAAAPITPAVVPERAPPAADRPVPPPQDVTIPQAAASTQPTPLSPPPFPRRTASQPASTAATDLPKVERTAMKRSTPFSDLVHPAQPLKEPAAEALPRPFPTAQPAPAAEPVRTSDAWTVDVIPSLR